MAAIVLIDEDRYAPTMAELCSNTQPLSTSPPSSRFHFVISPPGCSRLVRGWLALALGVALSGQLGCTCNDTTSRPTEEPGEQSQDPAPEASSAPATKPPAPLKGELHPSGPPLIVVPGKGLSAIRFGTNLKNLHRHMAAPCDKETAVRCLYVNRGVDFELKDGVVSGMKIHRRGRAVADPPENGPKHYGAFNGTMVPNIKPLLHRHVVIEEFGEPNKKEPLKGADGQVERHLYDEVILEYDKLDNGNVVLAAIELIPPKKD